MPPELSYQTTSENWPLAAQSGGASFRFTGTFDLARITKRAARIKNERLLRHLLEFLGAIGLVAMGDSLFIAWVSGHPWTFLFDRHFINLIVWVTLGMDLYFWAVLHQAKARAGGFDLLRGGNMQRWTANREVVDVYQVFTPEAQEAWDGALEQAQKHGRQAPVVEDVLLSLLLRNDVKWLMVRLGIDANEMQMLVAGVSAQASPGDTLLKLPYAALAEALKLHNRSVDPLMLLCGLLSVLPQDHPVLAVLYRLNVSFEEVELVATWIFHVEQFVEDLKAFRSLSRFRKDSEINAGMTSVPTPNLDQFSEDLTHAAKYGAIPLTMGREADLDQLFRLLSEGRERLLVKGAVGTGRKTVINELAYRMVTEEVPKPLQDKRLIKLELAAILGTSKPAEQVLMDCFREAERSGNIVFVIEDIHQLGKATSSRGLSLLEILVNHLQESPLAVICSTTLEDYQSTLRPTGTFDQVFTSYELKDLSPQAVILACCLRVSALENQTKTFFTYPAIVEAVNLSNQFSRGVGQPEKAIEVLTEAAQRTKGQPEDDRIVTPETIQGVVAEQTHVPQGQFTQKEADKLLNLEDEIAKAVIGQKEAVKAVAEALRRARSGLASGNRPLASFLFVGPTGVGKTEVARTLTRVYFGDERFLLRLDMSEYQGSDGLEKLLGTPGSTALTPFVNHLKNYPFCLFLLDEFEKASGDVLNLFLQVLDEGRLTTTAGETLDLTHTIVIATSNAGTLDIQNGLKAGEDLAKIKQGLLSEILTKFFKPELLNRFDGVIMFTPLTPEEVQKITGLQLGSLAKTLEDKGIKLQFSDALTAEVAAKAFDPLLGARPIRRYIQDHVENVVARLLLSAPPARGSTVTLDVENGEVVVK